MMLYNVPKQLCKELCRAHQTRWHEAQVFVIVCPYKLLLCASEMSPGREIQLKCIYDFVIAETMVNHTLLEAASTMLMVRLAAVSFNFVV